MATADEIRRRVEETDTARSARRATTAQQVGELAQRRTAIVEQLKEIERQLGEVLTAARTVLDLAELARFTDIPAADLTIWLDASTHRTKRRKTSDGAPGGKKTTRRTTAAAPASGPAQTSTPAEPTTRRDEASARALTRP